MSVPGRSRTKRTKGFPWALFFAIAAIAVGGWAMTTYLGSGTPKSILLLGVDEDKTRTDVVLLAHVDPKQGLVNLISLPRDTLVEIPCEGLKSCSSPNKLNHAHAYGGENGPAVTVATVERFLGIKIDGYIRVDFDGFEQVVDALGGVDLVIEKSMDYEDPYADPPLAIHFKGSPEPQHLDGADALRYVRYRNDGLGDIGRTERTRHFLVALARTIHANGVVAKLPTLVTTMNPYVKTDIDSATAVALARAAAKIDPANIQVAMVEGEPFITTSGAWVWQADEAKLREMVDRLITHPTPPAKEAD